jgi:hypothetical protein
MRRRYGKIIIEELFKYNSIYENMGFDVLCDKILNSDPVDEVVDCLFELNCREEIFRACNKRMDNYSSFYSEKIVPFVENATEELLSVFSHHESFVEAKHWGFSEYDSFHFAFDEDVNVGDFILTGDFLFHFNDFTPKTLNHFLDVMAYRGKNNNLFIAASDNVREPADFFLETDVSPLCLNDPRGFVVVGMKEFEDLTSDFLDHYL